MKFTWNPHAKACAQVGAPLVVAAAGLTLAAIVCHDATPAFGATAGAANELAGAAEAGYDAGPHAPAPVAIAARLAGPAGTAPAKAHDLDCLSEAVYFEARGESSAGQAAVAQVVLNRARNPAYPKSVCAVVFQAASRGGCQFSFVCDGAMARPLEPLAWRRARVVATRALEGYVMTAVGRALNFHAADVVPAGAGPAVARLGGHVFFIAAARQASGRDVSARRAAGADTIAATDASAATTHHAPRALRMALDDAGPFPKAEAATAAGSDD